MCEFFFFQAEDGIRDYDVTGVQTCALPICHVAENVHMGEEGQVLEHQPKPPLLGDQIIDDAAVEFDGPGVWVFEAGQHPQHRGLAASAGAKQAQNLTWLGGK